MNKTVFIGGSISIKVLPPEVKKRLDNIWTKEYNIITGDAPGVDKMVQEYYNSAYAYCNCRMNRGIVYGIGNEPRWNMCGWDYKQIPINKSCRRTVHESKDIEMCKDCDYAFFIWDGKSKGTKTNIIRCVSSKTLRDKYIYVLVYCKGKMYELKKPEHYSEMEREIKCLK